ncbi:acetyltransferase [Spirochaetia bacterium]|nr:acetyltransferase [Spirochaetia bacterium]
MDIRNENLLIRYATINDAGILCKWWNDGKIMAHAGFPNGINTTEEKIKNQILEETDDTTRRWIIEIDGKPSGEMNYRNKGNETAEIGIKICDFTKQEKGHGTKLLKMFIKYLFEKLKYKKIILDTNLNNKRAQHVYEKIGFKRIGIRENVWKNQLGELQTSIDYELLLEEYRE